MVLHVSGSSVEASRQEHSEQGLNSIYVNEQLGLTQEWVCRLRVMTGTCGKCLDVGRGGGLEEMAY